MIPVLLACLMCTADPEDVEAREQYQLYTFMKERLLEIALELEQLDALLDTAYSKQIAGKWNPIGKQKPVYDGIHKVPCIGECDPIVDLNNLTC
mgnify:CR=1 FL=1